MQTITYQGYGVDLGEYHNENKDLQNAMTAIINNDETAEWSFNNLNSKDASVTTPPQLKRHMAMFNLHSSNHTCIVKWRSR